MVLLYVCSSWFCPCSPSLSRVHARTRICPAANQIQSQRLLPQQYLGARNWTKRSALSVQNPSSYQFGRSMAIMGDPEAKSCTWDQVGLVADLSPATQRGVGQPPLLILCLLYSSLMYGLTRSWLQPTAGQCWKRLSRTCLSDLCWDLNRC